MLIIISTNFEFTTGFHPIPAAAVTGGSTAAATIKVTITTLNNPYRRRKLTNNLDKS